jgi:hypothetical protein
VITNLLFGIRLSTLLDRKQRSLDKVKLRIATTKQWCRIASAMHMSFFIERLRSSSICSSSPVLLPGLIRPFLVTFVITGPLIRLVAVALESAGQIGDPASQRVDQLKNIPQRALAQGKSFREDTRVRQLQLGDHRTQTREVGLTRGRGPAELVRKPLLLCSFVSFLRTNVEWTSRSTHRKGSSHT